MDHKLIVANWKSHKTIEEGALWFEEMSKHIENIDMSGKTIVVCPSFTALSLSIPPITNFKLPILLGAQNVSAFEEGAYTGEVSAQQIQELVEYVIIGHSERRTLLHETDHDVAEKVTRAKSCELKTIVCIQDEHTPVPQGADCVAYEPQASIGTGNAAEIEDVVRVAEIVKAQYPHVQFLYGGSVNEHNIKSFMQNILIDGLLIGTASLDAQQFATLLQQW